MNSIYTFNTLDHMRSEQTERLQAMRKQGVPDTVTGAIDHLDGLTQFEQYVGNVESAIGPCRRLLGKVSVGTLVMSAIGLAGHFSGNPTIAQVGTFVLAAGAGGTALMGLMYRSTVTAKRWVQKQTRDCVRVREEMESNLSRLSARDVAVSEQRLRQAAKTPGAASSLALVEQVEKEPGVVVAAQRLAATEQAVAANRALLTANRKELFDADGDRMQKAWNECVEDYRTNASLCMAGASAAVGLVAGLISGTEMGLVSAATTFMLSVPASRILSSYRIPANTERLMRRQIEHELRFDEAQLAPQRATLAAARERACGTYAQVVDQAAVMAEKSRPVIRREGNAITVGNLKLDRREQSAS